MNLHDIHQKLLRFGLTEQQANEIIEMIREFAMAVVKKVFSGGQDGHRG